MTNSGAAFHADNGTATEELRREREKEMKKILDRVEAKAAREAKRNRPIHIAKFDV